MTRAPIADTGRPLTPRERAVLDALLAPDFPGVEQLRAEAAEARVVGGCACGCPSIDLTTSPGAAFRVRVDAAIRGTDDELFLFTLGGRLGGIEYVRYSDGPHPAELPEPGLLTVTVAGAAD